MSELIDREAMDELKSFMGAKLPEVIEVYLRNAQKYVDTIQSSYEGGDAQSVADAAHPLKSSSGNLGLVALSELSLSIEISAKEVVAGEKTLDALAEDVGKINALYQESSALLESELE